ncbi:polyprenyl diphosphate synthase [Rathayibacter sp. AY1A5]|uniref:polyprenyl diphosphate synthase n=1 Tax=Rathayibacter sp. AY1A5 TaxID=2080523 RepID=UPI000CE812F0|nr:polyprenyl diphosphate synthase [Rathayibacter sp. AY1A5]PPF11622.1 di-trans,poly-cis-decaprenylcistransferase [Rathayibacter sp. AY1A5]
MSSASETPASVRNPSHIAIIMDGNRRWAKQRQIPPEDAHFYTAPAMIAAIRSAVALEIPHITFFCLSDSNLLRPDIEAEALRKLRSWLWTKEVVDTLADVRARAVVFGDGMSPFDAQHHLNVTDHQPSSPAITVGFAVNYNARHELERAANLVVRDRYRSLEEYYHSSEIPEVDLLIRTSGEHRTSGFLLWQAAFAEIYFTKTLWPDFNERDFRQAVGDYAMRERRFGR